MNAILFPQDGHVIVMYGSIDMALSALAAHVNINRVGRLAIPVARDFKFRGNCYVCQQKVFSSSIQYNRIQLSSLEILVTDSINLSRFVSGVGSGSSSDLPCGECRV